MSEIPKIFYDKDTIFHYCKSSTAIENILFEKQLRLTSRKKSNDPIENLDIGIFNSITAYPEHIVEIENNTNADVEKIRNDINLRVNNIRQVCFCKNKVFRKNNSIDYPKEYFGFLRPRMWDQYGDNYKGVCLAFSKTELLKDEKIILKNNVLYLNYESLELKDNNIDQNELYKIGINGYKKELIKYFDKLMFRKHKDYRDENEYRICTLTEDEYDFIDIQRSIKGIIVSPYNINEYTHKKLICYSKEMKIDLLYINWTENGVRLEKELHSPDNSLIIFYPRKS